MRTPFKATYIVAFHGRSGAMLGGLGVYFLNLLKTSSLFGGNYGEVWSDPVTTNIPPVVGIKKIVIAHGQSVDSIQVDYQLLGGVYLAGDKHGTFCEQTCILLQLQCSNHSICEEV